MYRLGAFGRSALGRFFSTNYQMITMNKHDKISLITLNRPAALNSLCMQLVEELVEALKDCDKDANVSAIVLTGSSKAFCAGADIKEMADHTLASAYKSNLLSKAHEISKTRKPIIAAVNGYALGGGCELAMMCDIILAGDKARFGQPEIKLGTLPGLGGSQRLTRYIGKSRAMEIVLTGNFMNAEEAVQRGLASRIVPEDKLVNEAVELAKKIASFSQPVVMMAKEAVNAAYETTLQTGLQFEFRLFHSSFGLHDRKEGMSAFSEKRNPRFKDE